MLLVNPPNLDPKYPEQTWSLVSIPSYLRTSEANGKVHILSVSSSTLWNVLPIMAMSRFISSTEENTTHTM